MESVPFRGLLGALHYSRTRTVLDIFTAESLLKKLQRGPDLCHWKTLKRSLRYLTDNTNHGTLLEQSGPPAVIKA